MRDGKEIIFTKHAMIRISHRALENAIRMAERFKKAMRTGYGKYGTEYWSDGDYTYVVAEQEDKYIVITVY